MHYYIEEFIVLECGAPHDSYGEQLSAIGEASTTMLVNHVRNNIERIGMRFLVLHKAGSSVGKATAEVARRVIDDEWSGRPASFAEMGELRALTAQAVFDGHRECATNTGLHDLLKQVVVVVPPEMIPQMTNELLAAAGFKTFPVNNYGLFVGTDPQATRIDMRTGKLGIFALSAKIHPYSADMKPRTGTPPPPPVDPQKSDDDIPF